MNTQLERNRFALGRTVITSGALATLNSADVVRALHRHSVGDWGDLADPDKGENERSLKQGCRLLWAYSDRPAPGFGSLPKPIAAPPPSCL